MSAGEQDCIGLRRGKEGEVEERADHAVLYYRSFMNYRGHFSRSRLVLSKTHIHHTQLSPLPVKYTLIPTFSKHCADLAW